MSTLESNTWNEQLQQQSAQQLVNTILEDNWFSEDERDLYTELVEKLKEENKGVIDVSHDAEQALIWKLIPDLFEWVDIPDFPLYTDHKGETFYEGTLDSGQNILVNKKGEYYMGGDFNSEKQQLQKVWGTWKKDRSSKQKKAKEKVNTWFRNTNPVYSPWDPNYEAEQLPVRDDLRGAGTMNVINDGVWERKWQMNPKYSSWDEWYTGEVLPTRDTSTDWHGTMQPIKDDPIGDDVYYRAPKNTPIPWKKPLNQWEFFHDGTDISESRIASRNFIKGEDQEADTWVIGDTRYMREDQEFSMYTPREDKYQGVQVEMTGDSESNGRIIHEEWEFSHDPDTVIPDSKMKSRSYIDSGTGENVLRGNKKYMDEPSEFGQEANEGGWKSWNELLAQINSIASIDDVSSILYDIRDANNEGIDTWAAKEKIQQYLTTHVWEKIQEYTSLVAWEYNHASFTWALAVVWSLLGTLNIARRAWVVLDTSWLQQVEDSISERVAWHYASLERNKLEARKTEIREQLWFWPEMSARISNSISTTGSNILNSTEIWSIEDFKNKLSQIIEDEVDTIQIPEWLSEEDKVLFSTVIEEGKNKLRTEPILLIEGLVSMFEEEKWKEGEWGNDSAKSGLEEEKSQAPSLTANIKLNELANTALVEAFWEWDINVTDIVTQLQKILTSWVTNYRYNRDLFSSKDGHPIRVKWFTLQAALWILWWNRVQWLLKKIDTGFGDKWHLAAWEYFWGEALNQLTPEHIQKIITELNKYQWVIYTLEKHEEKVELSNEQASILETARIMVVGDVEDGDVVRAVFKASLWRNLHANVPYVFKWDVDVKEWKILPKEYADESVVSQIKAWDYVGVDLAPFATWNIDNVIATWKVSGSVVEVITYKNGVPEVMNYDFSWEGAKVWRLRSINPQWSVKPQAKDTWWVNMEGQDIDVESYEWEKSTIWNELFLSPNIRREVEKYFPQPENITTTQMISFLEQIPDWFEFSPSKHKPPEIRALGLILQIITAHWLWEWNTLWKIDSGFGWLKSNSRKEFMRFQQEKLWLDPENPNEVERPSLVMNDFIKKALIDYLKTGWELMIESKEDPNNVYSEVFKKRLIPAAEKLWISPHIIQTVAFIEAKWVTDATRFEPHIHKRIVRERAAYDNYATKMTIKYQWKALEGLVNFWEGSPISSQDKAKRPDTSEYDNYASLMTTKYQWLTDIHSDPRITKAEKAAIPNRENYNTYLLSMATKYNPEWVKWVILDPDTSSVLSDQDRNAIPKRRYPPDENITQLSTSYSTFQIMWFNYKIAWYDSVNELVASISSWWVEAQSMAFANFVLANPTMHKALKNADWHTFARWYNGPAYAKNRYAHKLAKYSAMFA